MSNIGSIQKSVNFYILVISNLKWSRNTMCNIEIMKYLEINLTDVQGLSIENYRILKRK